MNEEIERMAAEVEQVHADRWRIFKQREEAEREVKRLQEELEKERNGKARLIEELTKCEIHFSFLSDRFSSEMFNSIQKLLAEME